MATICSRDLFPELVMTVNSTRFPEESRRVEPSNRKPAWERRRSAPAESYGGTGRAELNQKWFAGETGPKAGWACPAKTMRERSARLMAIETALRNSVERNQAFLISGSGAVRTWLNHNCSESRPGPVSWAAAGESFCKRSKYSASSVLIK